MAHEEEEKGREKEESTLPSRREGRQSLGRGEGKAGDEKENLKISHNKS